MAYEFRGWIETTLAVAVEGDPAHFGAFQDQVNDELGGYGHVLPIQTSGGPLGAMLPTQQEQTFYVRLGAPVNVFAIYLGIVGRIAEEHFPRPPAD